MADIVFPGDTPSGEIGREFLPNNFNLVLYKGDFFSMKVSIKNPDGSSIDLTGYQAAAQIRTNFPDPVMYAFQTSIDLSNGAVDLLLTSGTSSNIAAGDYVWDVQVTDPNGNSRTYLAGDVTVYDEVTR